MAKYAAHPTSHGAAALAAKRARAGLTLRDLADRIGCSASLLCRLERGGRRPGRDTMLAIERALGIHPSLWFRGCR